MQKLYDNIEITTRKYKKKITIKEINTCNINIKNKMKKDINITTGNNNFK